ncbi:fused MFS/spermidine synthase [Kitasatospora sp. YST-16]|uniref:spermidine synthase n=1 Tax=Kitasatospora sp. YST-16 TaxID=2998080 RepID=UPI00228348A5|nr:fused MFS/spermidine synthase [Kitasatospora sp. YST-16]WAL76008.1 fused MFS/spermidine synthase [Kitasatospora sp. YST-16]WNW42063.1 fused MFS/spermidine synthase [Streptomyces sp. Li-HN-5-13]
MSGPTAEGADPRPAEREVGHGTAKLIPDIDIEGGWLLTLDGTPQSYVDLEDPTHLEFEYVQRIAHLLDVVADSGEPLDVLHLGGGGLTLPRYLAKTRPGSSQQVVELDGPLTEFIAEHLPWPSGIEVTVGDARAVLGSVAAASVDVVVADVFRGSRTPAHLTSVEFVRLAAAALRPGGCYAANLADGPPLAFAKAQAATVAAVFAHVCLVAEPAVLRGRRYGNVLLIGSDEPLPSSELARLLAADPFPARLTETPEQAAEPVTDATAEDSPPPPSGAFSLG